MKKSLLFSLCILLATSLACSLGGLPGSGDPADPNLLFEDDFSNIFSGWETYSGDEGVTDYHDGGYRILVSQANYNYWSTPGQGEKLPGDVRIAVEARKLGGPDDNIFGVICRYTKENDLSSFYYFGVTSDGYAGIFKVTQSQETLLTGGGEQMVQTEAIKAGTESNQIQAECIGETLTLYVNGTQVDSVTDASFTSGDIGLLAGAYDTPGADISFDNLKVTKP